MIVSKQQALDILEGANIIGSKLGNRYQIANELLESDELDLDETLYTSAVQKVNRKSRDGKLKIRRFHGLRQALKYWADISHREPKNEKAAAEAKLYAEQVARFLKRKEEKQGDKVRKVSKLPEILESEGLPAPKLEVTHVAAQKRMRIRKKKDQKDDAPPRLSLAYVV